MKKIIFVTIISSRRFNCQTLKKEKIGKGIPYKTANPNIPFIYKKGYANYNIIETALPYPKNSELKNELRFHAVYSAMYTKQAMYNHFGKWTKVISKPNDLNPTLVWENVKLFDNDNQEFTVYTDGVEENEKMYASVIVLYNNQQDALTENSPYKEKIISLYSNAILNLKNNNKFSEEYIKIIEAIKRQYNIN